jgi:CelD/BcsL family acetyltransferase involved in cellulose biosynthesis
MAITVEAAATLPPTIAIRALEDPAWRAFVRGHPQATIFHHPAWAQLLSESYGYRSFALVQTDALGDVVAGLPVLATGSRMTGTTMMSLPFTDYCPPLARDIQARDHFVDGLLAWQRAGHCHAFDIRAEMSPRAGIHSALVGVRHVLPLDGGAESVLQNLQGTPVHRAIKKAQRLGVEVRVTQASRDLQAFYRLHWQTRQRLGVPVQPRRFVEALWARIIERDLGFLVLATKDDRPIAAAVFLAWNGHLIYKYGASDSEYWALRPNNLAFWTAIAWACARNYRVFDFGKSDLDNQGLRDFKSRWGSKELPLTYSHISAKPPPASHRLPERVLSNIITHSPPIVCRAIGELIYGRFGASADRWTHRPQAGAGATYRQ